MSTLAPGEVTGERPGDDARDGGGSARSHAFAIALVVITVAGFVLRLAYVWYARRGSCNSFAFDTGCPGDSRVYHYTANLLADGKGFINPFTYIASHGKVRVAAADHPPLFELVLAAVSFAGFKTWLAHQLVVVCIGTCSIVVAGLLGRDVFGERVGLVAAGLVALDANIWINDGNVMSESLTILTMLLVIWCAYRFWARPSIGWAAALGAMIGVTALTRPETAVLVAILAVPLALWSRSLALRDRLVRAAAAMVAALLVVSPWVAYNMTRFHHPVTLSTGAGITLANTNCDVTYYGPLIGSWSLSCVPKPPPGDQSDDEVFLRRVGLDYVKAHWRRVPVVVAARVGRMWNVFRVAQQVDLDFYEGRPTWASDVALAFFYPTMALAAYGAVLCRRRKIPLTPLVAPLVMVTFAAATAFGQARYRAPAEGAICLLAAVGIDGLLVKLSSGAAGGTPVPTGEQTR